MGQTTLVNHPDQFRRYFAQFPGPHQAFVAATGRWLRAVLQAEGVDLHVAHAKFLKAIAYAKVKTDAVDARTLGHLLRTGFIPEAHMISDERREPRDVLWTRLRLVRRAASAHNSGDRLLEKFNVTTVAALPRRSQAQAALHQAQDALPARPSASLGTASAARAARLSRDPTLALDPRHRTARGLHDLSRGR